jgi:ubiquinone/menaquinone biosynthesis C-methylase UbiE
MEINKKDYARVVYNEQDIPLTSYPQKLVNYLIEKYELKAGDNLLELGPARGDFIKEFYKKKLNIYGVDISDYAKEYCPEIKFKNADLEKENIPFDDNFFDVVYTKSFVEHFYYPEKIFSEIFRVLKPGGKIITLTPHWKYMYKYFYEDYSHRTPFTIESLDYIQKTCGFSNIQTLNFRQLPLIWNFKILIFLAEFTRIFLPDYLSKKFKWVRFSKEVMLLSKAEKPKTNI